MMFLKQSLAILLLSQCTAALNVAPKLKAKLKQTASSKKLNHGIVQPKKKSIRQLTKSIVSKSLRATSSYYGDDAFGSDDYSYTFGNETFALADFSIKFHSCASLRSFEIDDYQNGGDNQAQGDDAANDDAAVEDDGEVYPYTTNQVVNYRLCPTSSCQSDTWEGCRNIYGSNMITLEDYLDIQQEYEEQALEEYCDYCEQCVYFYNNFGAQCEYHDECSDYESMCYDNEGQKDCEYGYDCNEEEEELDIAEFLECSEFEVLEDASYYHYCSYCKQCEYMATYFGAECDDSAMCDKYSDICEDDDAERKLEEDEDQDKYYDEQEVNDRVFLKIFCDGSFKIGMFADDQCTNFIGDYFSIYNTTGLPIYEEEGEVENAIIQKDCVSCSKKAQQFYHTDYENGRDDDEEEEEDFLEMCENLYENSLKCNLNIPFDYYNEEQDDEWYESHSEDTCELLEAVQKGQINDYGCVSTSTYTCPTYDDDSSSSGEGKSSSSWWSSSSSSNKSSNYSNVISDRVRGMELTVGNIVLLLGTMILLSVMVTICCARGNKQSINKLELKSGLISKKSGVSV